jgi:ligand-binding SRPBCC domain-containing protein
MEEGKFKSFQHEHTFVEKDGKTVMIDDLNYETPFGIFGRLFDQFLLKKHLTNFIIERNKVLKYLAENQK